MPTEPQPVTLAEIVRRAAEVVDPQSGDPDIADFAVRFEDDDEPVTAVEDVEERIAEAAGALDPQQESGPIQVAAAVATYLAFRRDETHGNSDELVRLAVRAEFDGKPPKSVTNWLDINEIDM
jgi:class 3 adenylate cyclase